MPRPAKNVIPLPLEATSMHHFSVVVRELADLRHGVGEIADAPRWSAMEWGVASSPVLLRLHRVRRALADLDEIRVGRWPDTDWAMRFRAAHSEVERRLTDIRVSMSALASQEMISTDAVITFSSDAAMLGEAAEKFCGLIVDRYPAAADEIP